MPEPIDALQALLEKRNKALAECKRISKEVEENPTKGWTAENRAEFEKWKTEATNAKKEYDEKLADRNRVQWLTEESNNGNNPANRRVTDPASHGGGGNTSQSDSRIVNWNPYSTRPSFARVPDREIQMVGPRASASYAKAFGRYLKGTSASNAFSEFDSGVYNVVRSDDEEQGGYLVTSEQFMEGLLKDVDDMTFIQSLSRVLVVREARSLGIRKRTSKVNSITKGSELRDITGSFDNSLRFGKRVLTPYYYTGGIQVSRDWMRMSTMDGESIVRGEMALDVAEYNENQFLYGDGIEGALGVMVPSSEGIPTSRDISPVNGDWVAGETAAPTTRYTFSTLQRAKFNQKLQYRNRSRWMFHRDHVGYINTLRDLNGQYIFQASKQVGEPDRLLGLPFDESEYMPNTMTTGLYAGILACWEHYLIVYGLELEIQRLNEIAARSNQIEYHYRYKMDANVDLEEAFTRIKYA